MARSFSLMARSARAAFPPSRTAVAVTPASPTAARESPTPVAIFGTAWHTSRAALRCGLPQALAAAGYTVALVDLPGYGAARSMPVNWSVDDLVSDLHVALGAALPAAPVAIAPHAAAVLAQKYLESYPLAGLVALAPLPPSPDATLRRWARTRPGDPLARADLAAFLRSAASTPADAARLLLAPGASEAAAEACVEAAEAQCVSDGSGGEGADSARGPTHLCGVDAAAHLLALLADEPVRLEPQPVPMCVMAPLRGTDALVTWEETQATLALHAQEDAREELEFVQLDGGVGHDVWHADEAGGTRLRDAVVRWISERV